MIPTDKREELKKELLESQKREKPERGQVIRPFKKSEFAININVLYGLAVVIILALFIIVPFVQNYKVENVSAKELAEIIKEEEGPIELTIKDDETIDAKLKDGSVKRASYQEKEKSFSDFLNENGVTYEMQSEKLNTEYGSAFKISIDMILTIALIGLTGFAAYKIITTINASGSRMSEFGESTAKLLVGKKTNVTFNDVAGIEEAKEELKEIVDFLKEPKKFFKVGARIPRGVLLVGAPGTGKTLLARAVAGEANVPFFHTSGAEFEEMLVGAGASRVRSLFKRARRLSPCIIFIDEIDAVAKKREVSLRSSYTEQTLNQILVEMDGFARYDTVIVLAATNRPDILDPAILRPGRFDRKVVIDTPDMNGRLEILKVHSKGKPLGKDVDLEVIAKKTTGLSGADLENIMNESAIVAVRSGRQEILMEDVEEAIMKVILGPKRKSRKKVQENLFNTAIHEAGHAIVSYFTKGSDPVYKVSIVSRGMTEGITMMLPEDDKTNYTKEELLAKIRVSTGGRVAEEVHFGEISTGASKDIENATKIATKMVKELGMSDKLSFVKYGESMNEFWLGYSYESSSTYSEKFAAEIDSEIKSIIFNEYNEAKRILQKNIKKLKALADMLMEKEVVSKEEFEKFMAV